MNTTPNPSTYRQVLENMQEILNIAASMGDLTDLPLTVEEMAQMVKELNDKVLNPSDSGDLVNTDTGMKVLGLHVNTKDSEVNTAPNSYVQGLTVELKNRSKVGLGEIESFNSPYCFIMTMVKDSALTDEPASLNYVAMQIAFASGIFGLYGRSASSGTTWGNWSEVTDQGDNQQIIDSEMEPVDQDVGGYWMETVEAIDSATMEMSGDETPAEEPVADDTTTV